MFRFAFRHSRRDDSNTGFRHQLYANSRIGIAAFQVVDELKNNFILRKKKLYLSQIFDTVDVVMRRRRNLKLKLLTQTQVQ
jgi:hypothetical protein